MKGVMSLRKQHGYFKSEHEVNREAKVESENFFKINFLGWEEGGGEILVLRSLHNHFLVLLLISASK